MTTKSINCPDCDKPMKNMGNLSRMIYTSYPAQWDDVYVCHDCKIQKSVRVMGARDEDLWEPIKNYEVRK